MSDRPPAPLRFPDAVAAGVESDSRAVIVVQRLVLRKEDGLSTCRAQAAASKADPNLRGGFERKHACINLLAHEVGQRFRHWVLPGGHETSPRRPGAAMFFVATRGAHVV